LRTLALPGLWTAAGLLSCVEASATGYCSFSFLLSAEESAPWVSSAIHPANRGEGHCPGLPTANGWLCQTSRQRTSRKACFYSLVRLEKSAVSRPALHCTSATTRRLFRQTAEF